MAGGKDLLLKATKRRYELVSVPVLDAEFRIQSLTGKELNEFVGGATKKDETAQNVALLAMCLVDDEGNRLFTNGDAAQLQDLDLGVMVKLLDACQRHNHLGEDTQKAMVKN